MYEVKFSFGFGFGIKIRKFKIVSCELLWYAGLIWKSLSSYLQAVRPPSQDLERSEEDKWGERPDWFN